MPSEIEHPGPIENYQRAAAAAFEHLRDLVASPGGGAAVPRAADLGRLRAAEEALEVARTELVALVRNGVSEQMERGRLEIVHPHTWAEIADQLGTTRQAAQRKYESAVQERAPEGQIVTRVQRSQRRPAHSLTLPETDAAEGATAPLSSALDGAAPESVR